MKLYRTTGGLVVQRAGRHHRVAGLSWDDLFQQTDLGAFIEERLQDSEQIDAVPAEELLPPLQSQEVWAAGVTYRRSRTARMEESREAGGESFYDRVYEAERPEIFFKATAHRTVTHGQAVAIRSDSRWSVPEPELTLVVSSRGEIFGYTIGNDMSARDIEGDNPLYLPQAKVYDRCCSIGPCILLRRGPLPPETEIRLNILRGGQVVFFGSTRTGAMKRTPRELVRYLFRHNSFPHGCFLLTGTGVIPPEDFTLHHGDEVRITIPPIGTLVNQVEALPIEE
jgi:2-dehydro-3-deoxy-D-arabinonate dehydratase